MEQQMNWALHESMELHELINFKTISLARSKLMQGLVFDQDLRGLMQKNVQQSLQDLHDLTELYRQSYIH